MKTYLYLLCTLRNGKKDGAIVVGGIYYHHYQLLLVIDAIDHVEAARALNTQITSSFDRSRVNCPSIYYTSNYYGDRPNPPLRNNEGYYFLSLKELEPSDAHRYPDLETKTHFKITAPQVA